MAKNLDDLRESRDERLKVLDFFGGIVPESILAADWSDYVTDETIEDGARDYMSTGYAAQVTEQQLKAEGDPIERERKMRDAEKYSLSGAGARWGGLSRFPRNIGRIMLRLYSKSGDTVVDPFAGHNSRMELCYRERRNYIGCDISKKFMQANFKRREELLDENAHSLFPALNKATIELHECDSRKMPVKNNVGDFTITSPPYWCLEDYGDEMCQLGKNDYQHFLIGLGEVAKQNFRCLKSGSFAAWFVNDFRWEGKFYSYHTHTIQLMRDAGFKIWDTAIVDLGSSFRASFASQIRPSKILPKRHEYALIFRKP